MLFVRLCLVFASLILFVVVAKLVLTLALIAAIAVVGVLAIRYVRLFLSSALARRPPVAPLPQRSVRVVRL